MFSMSAQVLWRARLQTWCSQVRMASCRPLCPAVTLTPAAVARRRCCISGDVSMSKVKWDAKSDHEFINNYKILQRAFDKRGIVKVKLVGCFRGLVRSTDARVDVIVTSCDSTLRWRSCVAPSIRTTWSSCNGSSHSLTRTTTVRRMTPWRAELLERVRVDGRVGRCECFAHTVWRGLGDG